MQFHVLRRTVGGDSETYFELEDGGPPGPAPRCPSCDRFVGGLAPPPPYVARLRLYSDHLGDVAFGSGGILISALLLDAARTLGLKGLEDAAPVFVSSVRPRTHEPQHPAFALLGPRHGRARVDESRSIFVRRAPAECRYCLGGGAIDAILKLELDDRSPPDEDIFIPWGANGVTVVTNRFLEMTQRHALRNVTTVPIEQFRWDPLGLAEKGRRTIET